MKPLLLSAALLLGAIASATAQPGTSAFVARRCVGSKVETVGGVFQVRENEPAPRMGTGLHRTP